MQFLKVTACQKPCIEPRGFTFLISFQFKMSPDDKGRSVGSTFPVELLSESYEVPASERASNSSLIAEIRKPLSGEESASATVGSSEVGLLLLFFVS